MKIIALGFSVLFLFSVAVSVFCLEYSIVVLAALAAGALAIIGAIVSVIARRRSRKFVAVTLVSLTVSLGGIMSVAWWDWPLRIAFIVSRPALEVAAADVRNGRVFTNRRA